MVCMVLPKIKIMNKSTSRSLAQEIENIFEIQDKEMISGFVEILELSEMSADDLLNKWMVFTTSSKSLDLDSFKSWISLSESAEKEKENAAANSSKISLKKKMLTKDSIAASIIPPPPPPHHATPFKPTMAPSDLHLSSPAPFSSAFSPGLAKFTPQTTTARSTDFSAHFRDRKLKGKVEAVFADHISFPQRSATDALVPCLISVVEGQQTSGYRYMYEKLTEKGDLLNDRINFFASLFAADILALRRKKNAEEESDEKEAEAASEEESLTGNELLLFGHPAMVSQASQFYIGRISCDTVVEGTRLNIQSLVLETSREIGAGARVKIDFGGLIAKGTPLNLFPGQIICVEAANPSGSCLCVIDLLDVPQLPPTVSYGKEYKAMYPQDKVQDLSILFAAGPFTLSDSLEYEALDELLEVAMKESPNLLLLMGPFVDIDHSLFGPKAAMDQELSFEEVFRLKFAAKLEKCKKIMPHLQIVLVPSQKEATLEWIAYPQPPIGSSIREQDHIEKLQSLGLMNRNGDIWAHLFPNPVQFTCNEVVIALSNIDTIRDLIQLGMTVNPPKSETEDGTKPTPRDKFTTCFTSILSQRHFYPVFPPTPGACIDSTRALASHPQDPCVLQARPDILIMPSKLQFAIKAVDECLCINPGVLVRGRTGGTYCLVRTHALETTSMDDTDCFENHVSARSRVQIVKL